MEERILKAYEDRPKGWLFELACAIVVVALLVWSGSAVEASGTGQDGGQIALNILAGIATDEADTDAAIDRLADCLSYSLEHKNTGPQNFLGIGCMKIFRDLIWQMQGLMREDHRFFKSHGQYDFPQKKRGRMMAMYLVGSLMSNPKLQKKMGGKMNEGMLMPYKKLFADMDKEK